uniref:Vav 3 guanine nucleotide exchange factor b n=1 Tax=Oreochromis niloticus TaxID=8128 RepID=A0A669CHZ5_ORENI
MEYWRQCAMWLISCNVLPANHRVTADTAQVPHTINLKEINLRPQMSQFLCLKNIRTFLASCCDVFGMKKSDLFEAFDLFDVRDFGKVWCLFFCVCYSESVPEDEDDLYAAVYGLEDDYAGGEIYEDLMRTEQPPPLKQAEVDIRSCCLTEIKQTEEKYTETLESIEKVLNSLTSSVYCFHCTYTSLDNALCASFASALTTMILEFKKNIYMLSFLLPVRVTSIGHLTCMYLMHSRSYCSVTVFLFQECSKRANNGKFTLRDLLVVPMQRVLKYHLLLQELVKHTQDAADKSNLKIALDAMKDLAQYVNEVKRDNETLREIDQYQRSIENLNTPLVTYGRPKGDGEVRIVSSVDKKKQDRHIFLFDVAVIVCKRRGDNYEMKDILDLNYFKITNNPTSDRECKKWCYGFYVTHQQGHTGFELFFKTRELKKKWLDQFEMAISNIRPEKATHNSHHFKMHTFERITSCSFCHLLLRGIFNQGYLCLKCGLGAHKECLGRLGVCGRTGETKTSQTICFAQSHILGLPRMVVIRDYSGIPSSQCGTPLSIHVGDVIELMFADLQSFWWQGKNLATSKIGFFPSDAVRPCPSCLWMLRFAGPMERCQAEVALLDRENGTYLIRHRSKECTEYAISIKFNDKVKHIKILTKDGGFYIAETRVFKTVLDLVEYYQQHSLKEGFSSLDTTLQHPYREQPNGNIKPLAKMVGYAIARYDFCSRDTRELSLQQGDVITIYTKMPNGWWKGVVGDRVGWFPSTYVEEED